MVNLMIEMGEKQRNILVQIQRWCFICGVGTIPIMTGSLKLPIAGNQMAYIFIAMGILIFFVEDYIYPNTLITMERNIIKFLEIMFLWAFLCSVWGAFLYPSFANIDLNQMRSFRNLFYHLKPFYPSITDLSFLKGWMIYRALRNSIAYVASSYLISFWIYHLYYKNWRKGIQDLKKAILMAALLMIPYSTIEVGFLCGNSVCKAILGLINARIFDVASGQGWWPPLFWDQLQMRSLFPEPSHLGIFLSMALPLFFTDFFSKINKKTVFKLLIYFCLIMMLFMSKARTGTIVVGIEFFLFICGVFIYAPLSLREKFKRLSFLVCWTALPFALSLVIMSNFESIDSKVSDSHENISIQNYVQNNVTSITGNQRSNSTRYANALATLKVGIEHPLFGVGIFTRNAYVAKQLTYNDKNIGEIKLWLKYMDDEGPMQSGFPDTNHFVTIFAEQGIIGLILFICPSCLVLLNLFSKKNNNIKQDIETISISAALIGLNIALLANEDHIGIFIVLGVVMAMAWRKEEVLKNEFRN